MLVDGSCVSVWSDNAYRSDDIDLIAEGIGQRARIRLAMLELGFTEKNRYFVHADTAFWIEFPAGPLAVGEERPRHIAEQTLKTGVLRLLSATDCVKDRLTWWYHQQDRQCLEQAVTVAQTTPVDCEELRRWSVGEHRSEAFAQIESRLRPQRS